MSGLSIQQKPVGGEVEAGAQVKQQFNMACVQDFTEAPMLHIQFMYGHMTSHWIKTEDTYGLKMYR